MSVSANVTPINLRNLDLAQMQSFVDELAQPKFRAEQLFRWVHGKQVANITEMTNLSSSLRDQLVNYASLQALTIESQSLASDGTRKLLFKTHDGRVIESVLIPDLKANDEDLKLTQCISSQVGCAIDCKFCATAKLGFGRHLSVAEIVSQVYSADQILQQAHTQDPAENTTEPARLTNLVFMGMGEPLHNYDNVVRSIGILLHPLGKALSRRRITISTSGLVPALQKLAKEPIRVHLAISLNATTDEQRTQIMPINRKYNLAMLLDTLRNYPLERRQRITFEYVLLKDFNDSLADARRLPALLAGIPAKINLIPWNPHPGAPFARPERETVLAFQAELMRLGFAVYIRKTRGDDIDAACGQLAANFDPRAGRVKRLPVLS